MKTKKQIDTIQERMDKELRENCITPVIIHHPRKHKARITYDTKFKLWRIWIE